MRTALVCGLVLLSTPALADPCGVTISRAPDDVREAIESWVSAEPSCSTTADVRVVETEDGYYLIAIDGNGRVHERVVPDAQSAGVLVASWIADDSVGPAPPPEARAPRAEAPAMVVAAVAPAPPPPRPATARWLTLGPSIQLAGVGVAGLRGDVDLKRRGAWSVGLTAAGTAMTSDMEYYSVVSAYTVRGLVDGAHTSTRGPWSLRLSLGVGALYSRTTYDFGELETHEDTFPIAEVSALGARDVGHGWGLAIGPVLAVSLDPQTLAQHEWTLYGGVRHRI